MKRTMTRTNFYFTPLVLQMLHEESRITGNSMSEIIRRAVEEYLSFRARERRRQR